MKEVPNKIYLQADPENELPVYFQVTEGVTWCADKIFDNDLEFIFSPVLQSYIQSRIKIIKELKTQSDEDQEFIYSILSKEKLDELKLLQKFLEEL